MVSETEYTGAGKHIQPQLTFARENGIDIRFGSPKEDIPGTNLILPENPGLVRHKDADLDRMRKSLIQRAAKKVSADKMTAEDMAFLAAETKTDMDYVRAMLKL